MKNKKGVEFPYIIFGLLMLLVLFVIFLPLIQDFKNASESNGDRISCLNEVIAASGSLGLRQLGSEVVEVTAGDEAEEYIESRINPDFPSCKTNILNVDEKEPEKIKPIIANEMLNCFEKFGSGKYNPFSDYGTNCFICTQVVFEDKDIMVEEFNDYLLSHSPSDSELYFADILQGCEEKGCAQEQTANLDFTYSTFMTDEDFYIVFSGHYSKEPDVFYEGLKDTLKDPLFIFLTAPAGELVGGGILLISGDDGEEFFGSAVSFFQAEQTDLNLFCDYLYFNNE